VKIKHFKISFATVPLNVKVAGGAAILLLLVGGAFAATHTSQHSYLPAVKPAPANKVLAIATKSSSPTPTASPAATHTSTGNAKVVTSQLRVLAPRVFIPVVPMGPVSTPTPTPEGSPSASPAPTPSPVGYDPQIEAWFYSYASSLFNNIYTTFEKMGTDANNNDIVGIVGDCQTEAIWAHDLESSEPPVPNSGMNLSLDTNLNWLTEGSQQCVEGINNNDSNEAVNGVNAIEDSILALVSLQQEMVPSN
jgi:hypothetical protein